MKIIQEEKENKIDSIRNYYQKLSLYLRLIKNYQMII